MERALGLMAGAGVLPGRAAEEATRQGWRVVAFAFEDAPGLDERCHTVIPSRIDNIQAVLEELAARHVCAALFVGKFWKDRVFAHVDSEADQAARSLASGGLSDRALTEAVVATLGALGIEVLDQRRFLSPRMETAGALTTRGPTDEEWSEIRAGLTLARHLAAFGIGQTVVRARGVTVAVEAVEGTDATIRRATRLSGPGAVVVKAVAPSHDYRFDTPTVGPATIDAMADGGATALGVQRGNVLVVDREEVVRLAERARITVVCVDAPDCL